MDRALVPEEDEDVPGFWRALGLPGLADVHVHFLPPRLLRRVWQYFDEAGPLVGVSWPIRYKWSDAARVAHLRSMGVRMFSALAYAHRPGMAADLNEWTLEFGRTTAECLPSATFYPEPGVTGYVRAALAAGARVFKVHLQVGGFAPDDPQLDEVWGLLAEARVPLPGEGRGRGPADSGGARVSPGGRPAVRLDSHRSADAGLPGVVTRGERPIRRVPASVMIALILLAAAGLLLPFHQAAAQIARWHPPPWQVQLALWPGQVPHAVETQVPEDTTLLTTHPVAGQPWVFIEKVARPTIAVYPPKKGNTGAAVLVFPGGGYHILAIDLEGTEVCEWLTSRGVTCIVLKYRVPGVGKGPKSGAYPRSLAALDDAQRALGLVRFHAAEWSIDRHKIGVLGFSAGGHLAAAISTNYGRRLYRAVDSADAVSCRPDFAVVIYPGHLLEHTTRPFQLNPYVPVTHDTPPTFLVQAEDDPVDDVENALVYYTALKKAGVPAEIHLFPHGGHAFGLRPTGLPITRWPALVETWMGGLGVLPSGAKP